MLLRRESQEGRIHLPKDGPGTVNLVEELLKVCFAKDGKVDVATVHPAVAAFAKTVEYMVYMRESMKVPLEDVQTKYFEMLLSVFGVPFGEMRKHSLTPVQVASDISRRKKAVEAWNGDKHGFASMVTEFWNANADIVYFHMENLKGLKASFGGDIFPSTEHNLVTSVGLYMDTVILPDPMLRAIPLTDIMEPHRHLYYVVKHALNVLNYKELVLSGLSPPIAVIVPDQSNLDSRFRTFLAEVADDDVLEHCKVMFGQDFESIDKLRDFASKLKTEADLLAVVRQGDRLLFDTEWEPGAGAQLHRHLKEHAKQFTVDFSKDGIGGIVYPMMSGRMMQANDAVMRAERLGASPLIDAPTSWQYLLWKFENDARRGRPSGDPKGMVIARALHDVGSGSTSLLGGLSPRALIELRRQGAAADIRELILKGVEEVRSANDKTVQAVANQVTENLKVAFAQHQGDLSEVARGKRKFYGLDVAGCIVGTAVSVGLGLAGGIGNSVVREMLGATGAVPTVKDLKVRWKALQEREAIIRNSPVAFLFRGSTKS